MKLEFYQDTSQTERLKSESIKILEAKKNELYHKLDLDHQQLLSEIKVTVYSCESYRLESKVNLSKEKQKISADF